MAFVAIICLLLVVASPGSTEKCGCRDGLNFRGDNTKDHGISVGSSETLKAITACFWMAVPESYVKIKAHHPSPLSYAVKGAGSGNEFLLSFEPQLKVYLKAGKPVNTGVIIADGKLHHVCVTWESLSGRLKVYNDGGLVKTRNNIKTGQKITAGGTWVIGQDQDIVGGKFQARDSFKGYLTEMNIWNRVLCLSEIARVGKNCGSLVSGNYKSFSDFEVSKDVQRVRLSCCPTGTCA